MAESDARRLAEEFERVYLASTDRGTAGPDDPALQRVNLLVVIQELVDASRYDKRDGWELAFDVVHEFTDGDLNADALAWLVAALARELAASGWVGFDA